MPRRNRNVSAYRIDADELADQAAELAADLSRAYPSTLRFLDAIEAHDRFTGRYRVQEATVLRAYVCKVLNTTWGGQARWIDVKAVTSHGQN